MTTPSTRNNQCVVTKQTGGTFYKCVDNRFPFQSACSFFVLYLSLYKCKYYESQCGNCTNKKAMRDALAMKRLDDL